MGKGCPSLVQHQHISMFKLPHYTSDIMVLKKFTPPIVVLVEILIVLLIKLGLFSTFCTSALFYS